MLLKNIKVINHNETIENANVLVENGFIKSVEKIEGEGTRILIPGFVDTHIHGFKGKDFMDSVEAIQEISAELVKEGTTSFFPTVMTSSLENIKKSLSEVAAVAQRDRKIKGIHLEGPFISIEKKGAHDESFIIKPTEELLEELQLAAAGLIKKITFAPEVTSSSIIKKMLELNMNPTIGHTNADYDQVVSAIKDGADSATHLWNAMSGVSNRQPGAVEAILNNESVYAEIITDLIHVDKEAIALSVNAKGKDKVVVITDSIRPSGLEDGEYQSGGIDVVKNGLKITLKGTDTIAGSGATMHSSFINLVKLGYNLNDIVAMTSYNASINMDLKNIGVIEEGYKADLVIMDNDYKIEEVYAKGIKA